MDIASHELKTSIVLITETDSKSSHTHPIRMNIIRLSDL